MSDRLRELLSETPTASDRECAEAALHCPDYRQTDDPASDYDAHERWATSVIATHREAHVAPIRAKLDQAVGLLWEIKHYGGGAVDACSDHYVMGRVDQILATIPTAGGEGGVMSQCPFNGPVSVVVSRSTHQDNAFRVSGRGIRGWSKSLMLSGNNEMSYANAEWLRDAINEKIARDAANAGEGKG